MARPKIYKISLIDDELIKLKAIIRRKNTSNTIKCRCQILIDLDEAHGDIFTHQQSARSNEIRMSTVTNTIKLYADGGIDSVVSIKRSVNSDNARRKLDGCAEARLIEIACSPALEEHSRRTLRLLEEEAKVALDTSVGKNAIGRALKKQASASQKQILVYSPKGDAEFVACMEDVLDVYELPYDP